MAAPRQEHPDHLNRTVGLWLLLCAAGVSVLVVFAYAMRPRKILRMPRHLDQDHPHEARPMPPGDFDRG